MFRSSTVLRELVQSLAKVTLLLKHSVKLCHCILCGDVAACRETACVLFVVQTAVCTTNKKKKPTTFRSLQLSPFLGGMYEGKSTDADCGDCRRPSE